MKITLIYLFDPLCGWCYGAMPTLSSITNASGIALEMLPTGLFAGESARKMDDDFAAYAWSNDQRIAHLTGQVFTERYRQFVLGDRQQMFDSEPATLALTAVSLTAPAEEYEALKAIQYARFVEGQDITKLAVLVAILKSLGLTDAVLRIEEDYANLLEANHARIRRAQAMMQKFNARGVPTFIADSGEKCFMLNTNDMYSNPQALIRQLQQGI